MSQDPQTQGQDTKPDDTQESTQASTQENTQPREQEAAPALNEVDGLANKKPEELTPEELRLMADTMPGEGPGD